MEVIDRPTVELRDRDAVCLLGLPIDVIDMKGAMREVQDAVSARRRLFVSTPNLNFLITAQKDAAFRESVLHSQLSLADGMSIVMLGRIMGCKLPERVTGSDLFEQLSKEDTPNKIKVYFFGGPPGAARLAAERVNESSTGMVCVGHDEAGFGDISSMSSQETIDRINASRADFLVVALGAQKGQAWLMHNQHRLLVPVISHLGAVINFMAGTVQRSPKWLQAVGLEWVWRIYEEPTLWRRYWHDGLAFLSLLARHGVSSAVAERRARSSHQKAGELLVLSSNPHALSLKLRGSWSSHNLPQLKALVAESTSARVDIDLQDATWMDTHVLGYLAILHGSLQRMGGRVQLLRPGSIMESHIRACGASYLISESDHLMIEAQA
jgi:N-acetylglucosaminyldiphosphoundecaprenol N-acetyl-beta-D-mannosaminyltransferase